MSDGTDDGRTLGRRHLLAGLAGVGLVGAGLVGGDVLDGGATSGAEATDASLPVEVTAIDAVGSTAGARSVPTPGTPTVVDCFATWCGPCAEQMAALGTVHDRYADRASFVSVTNERFGEGLGPADLRAWWREHDGRWTLGHDPEGDLLAALGADGLPYLAVTDGSGAVTWRHGGVVSAGTLADRIDAALP
jgi:thiol-disulfide isomerase/thioredoxin